MSDEEVVKKIYDVFRKRLDEELKVFEKKLDDEKVDYIPDFEIKPLIKAVKDFVSVTGPKHDEKISEKDTEEY